jgi:hypothetical protein
MKRLIASIAAFAAVAATPALAREDGPTRNLQVSSYAGAFVPTGAQRDVLDDGFLAGLTLSYETSPHVAIVGSFGWAGSEGRETLTLGQDVDVFQYDCGVQGQVPLALGSGLTLKPFVGAGVGARTYDVRDLDHGSETDFVGYVSAGANLEYRRLGLGLTVRDYLSTNSDFGTEDAHTRNDLALFASVGARF